MISATKAAEWIARGDFGVNDVEVDEEGFVRGELANPADHDQPHVLIVHPIEGTRTFRIFTMLRCRCDTNDSTLLSSIIALNSDIEFGSLLVDAEGSVALRIQIPCMNSDSEDPSREAFHRLISSTIVSAYKVHRALTEFHLRRLGISREKVKEWTDSIFGEEDD